jgi:hypothetical protein
LSEGLLVQKVLFSGATIPVVESSADANKKPIKRKKIRREYQVAPAAGIVFFLSGLLKERQKEKFSQFCGAEPFLQNTAKQNSQIFPAQLGGGEERLGWGGGRHSYRPVIS